MTSSFIEILRFIISGAMMYQLAEEHKRPGGVRLSVEQLWILPPVLVSVEAVFFYPRATLAQPD